MAKATGTNPTIEEYGTAIVVEKQRDILRSLGVLELEAAEKVTAEEGEMTIGRSNLSVPLFLTESGTTANSEFYEAFVNTYANKLSTKELTETYIKGKLEKYRKEAFIQHTVKFAFDFQISDADKYNILFECKNGIKWIWQFIFLSYYDQELLLLESRYQHVAKDFERLNTFQTQKGMIAKKDASKVCKLFQFPQGHFFEIDGAKNTMR